ncbi:MvdC/MvdD family ATP grasp protein [Actinomadura adrarensis]|uniref:MvdC/MvdD family ATP grasp protein n=1 Tax=Actinomadura adrarensis TaxID=1819600 RepID=A0ABW3CUC6_9ACTN
MNDTVLVMTDATDYTADLIVADLQARGMRVARLDPGAGPVRMQATLAHGRWRNTVGDEHRVIDLGEVVSVLWRWPSSPTGHPAIDDPARRAWAAREDSEAMLGVLKSLPVRWINHPDRVARANSKPGQLVTAAKCGLTVPDTIVTTSGEAAHRWARGREVLFKAFHAQGADEDAMVIATRVDPAKLPDTLGAACIFQEVIPGTPVRLTMIGTQAFAVAITGTSDLDWRPVQHRLAFTPTDVPPDVLAGVRQFMDCYRLEYGALDFISTADDAWTFLEVNPTGMYGFVEIQSGLSITEAIADRLCEPVHSPIRPSSQVGR